VTRNIVDHELHDWKDTGLWKIINEKTDHLSQSVSARILEILPGIQAILAVTPSPIDFTLHDAQHAFRVAERMIQVISTEVVSKLSVYELGLLLLSAYLHDIGMTPARRHVELHYHYLLTGHVVENVIGSESGETRRLSEQDLKDFQKWLDEQPREVSIPISSNTPTPDQLAQAEELVAYYCRGRHNDWSKDWISNNLSASLGSYSGWRDDLIDLCQSHHWPYHQLVTDRFNPRPVSEGQIVHLRFLACVLRVADILENDPERTPGVIFNHRDISPRIRDLPLVPFDPTA